MNDTVFYKMIITKNDLSCVLYHTEKTYKKFLNFVDEINQVVDAIELESITKEEYYKHELV